VALPEETEERLESMVGASLKFREWPESDSLAVVADQGGVRAENLEALRDEGSRALSPGACGAPTLLANLRRPFGAPERRQVEHE
jgi:hypothetical protein